MAPFPLKKILRLIVSLTSGGSQPFATIMTAPGDQDFLLASMSTHTPVTCTDIHTSTHAPAHPHTHSAHLHMHVRTHLET